MAKPTKSSYSEKLRDPRWQKKRLQIMERDGFRCQKCMDDQTTLNVHHLYYLRGVEPWGHPTSCLITLCEDCHATAPMSQHRLLEAFAHVNDRCLAPFVCEFESEEFPNAQLRIFTALMQHGDKMCELIEWFDGLSAAEQAGIRGEEI